MKTREYEPAALLRQWLENGRFVSGERLPAERALAESLGVTRPVLRKALSLLEAENLIWRHIGKGTFAGPRPAEKQESANEVTQVTNPSEVMEVRLVLEPQIAGIAALKSTQQEHNHMDLCIKKSMTAVNTAEFEKWDGALHEAIATSTKNALLISVFKLINSARDEEVWGQLKAASLTNERRKNYILQHTDIVNAIKERNATKANKAMYRHLAIVQKNMFGN